MLYCVSMDVSIGVSMVVFEASVETSDEACLSLRDQLFGQQNRASKSVQKVSLSLLKFYRIAMLGAYTYVNL